MGRPRTLPSAGLSLLAGKPKAGKTTLARCRALSVARGQPWLGFATTPGCVLYLALEEKRSEVRRHFAVMGATADDPVFVLCASVPEDALARLHAEAGRRKPVLIIVDPLFRFVRVLDGNDYAMRPSVRIVDSIGDAVFCAGEDTVAVVRTALRLREAVEREPGFLRVSIGIHRGPIVERDGRLFGSPINLTARVTAHAAPGQVLCTEPVALMVKTCPGLRCRPVGARRFKNITRQVALLEVLPVSEAGTTTLTDPVCHMHVAPDGAAATLFHEGVPYHFCSAQCARLFSDAPSLYVPSS